MWVYFPAEHAMNQFQQSTKHEQWMVKRKIEFVSKKCLRSETRSADWTYLLVEPCWCLLVGHLRSSWLVHGVLSWKLDTRAFQRVGKAARRIRTKKSDIVLDVQSSRGKQENTTRMFRRQARWHYSSDCCRTAFAGCSLVGGQDRKLHVRHVFPDAGLLRLRLHEITLIVTVEHGAQTGGGQI